MLYAQTFRSAAGGLRHWKHVARTVQHSQIITHIAMIFHHSALSSLRSTLAVSSVPSTVHRCRPVSPPRLCLLWHGVTPVHTDFLVHGANSCSVLTASSGTLYLLLRIPQVFRIAFVLELHSMHSLDRSVRH